jgi:hypothetical protein
MLEFLQQRFGKARVDTYSRFGLFVVVVLIVDTYILVYSISGGTGVIDIACGASFSVCLIEGGKILIQGSPTLNSGM